MSKKETIKKPFDVVMNEKIFLGDSHRKGGGNDDILEHLIEKRWGEGDLQPNIKRVVKMGTIPITSSNEEMNNYLSDNDLKWYDKKYKYIPYMDWEVETNDKGEYSSITLIQKINGKYYKVISKKDYGIIKSRFQLDEKGNFKNYEKCDLVPYEGKMEIYSVDKSDKNYPTSHLEYNLNIKDGLLDGKSIRTYKGDDYYEEITNYKKGNKDGLYENTKTLVKGNYVNGKKDGDWVESLNLSKMFDVSSIKLRIDNFYEWKLKDNFNVKYVNGKLNGKFSNDSNIIGYFIDGKLCGDLSVDGFTIPLINNLIHGSMKKEKDGYHYGKRIQTLSFEMGEFLSYIEKDNRDSKGEITIEKPNNIKFLFKRFDGDDTHRENNVWMNKDIVDGFYNKIPKKVKDNITEISKEVDNQYFEKRYSLVYYNLGDGKTYGGITNEDGRFINGIEPEYKGEHDFWRYEDKFQKYNSIYGFYIQNKFYVMDDNKKPILVFDNLSERWWKRYSGNHLIKDLILSDEIKQRLELIEEKFKNNIEIKQHRKDIKEQKEKQKVNNEEIGTFESFPMD